MRLIDADALKQEIRKGTRYFVRVWDPKGREKWEMEKDLSQKEIDEIIDNAPTIDAVQVVRCKDCRWFDKKTEHSSYGYCHAMKHAYLSKDWEIRIYRTQKEDFYCADGEKMYEEEDR